MLIQLSLTVFLSLSCLMIGHAFDKKKKELGLCGDIYSTIGFLIGLIISFLIYKN